MRGDAESNKPEAESDNGVVHDVPWEHEYIYLNVLRRVCSTDICPMFLFILGNSTRI